MVSLQQGALQIFCGALGTLGFALFFFVRPKHLLLATLGGALYYSMSALIQEDMDTFFQKGKEAGLVALGIGVGILIASEIVRLLMWSNRHRKRRLSRKTRRHPRRTDQN